MKDERSNLNISGKKQPDRSSGIGSDPGTDEATVANEIAKMEQEHIICGYHTLIDWDKTSADKVTAPDRGPRDPSEARALIPSLSGSTIIRKSVLCI